MQIARLRVCVSRSHHHLMSSASTNPSPPLTHSSSYGQILKSSSILGGTQILVYLISLLKNKAAAVFLGPSGVGLVALYTSATSLVATLSGLGLSSSGVREVAEAASTGDADRIARTIKVLRNMCWLTGLAGWLITVALARPLSMWTFGSHEFAGEIALLGATVFLNAVSAGQVAILQGMRRIPDLARVNILCVVFGGLFSVALYALFREAGILPALIVSAIISLSINWLFSRKIRLQSVVVPLRQMFAASRGLLRLGLALMWTSLLVAGVALVTRSLVVRELGLQANGIFQAAWTISGMFSGFVLTAMSADFYPRLTAAAADHQKMTTLVNEQAEVGVLLALPGFLATVIYAPLVIAVLYTSQFSLAAQLLPFLILGVAIQVASWPLGFVLLAKGESVKFALVETVIYTSQVALTFMLLKLYGLVGVAAAFAATQVIYNMLYRAVVGRCIGFAWLFPVKRVLLKCVLLMALALALHYCTLGLPRFVAGGIVLAATTVFAVRELALRVEKTSKVGALLKSIPCSKWVLGI